MIELIKKIEESNPGVTFIKSMSPKFNTDCYSENEQYILNNNIAAFKIVVDIMCNKSCLEITLIAD